MGNADSFPEDPENAKGFPGSAILDNFQCGSLDDAEDSPHKKGKNSHLSKFFNQAETLCAASPTESGFMGSNFDGEYEEFRKDLEDDDASGKHRNSSNGPTSPSNPANPTSALFARALVNEVTNNPNTMTPAAMAERETRLLKAQNKARQRQKLGDTGAKPVGAPGGIGQPSVLGSIAHALTGTTDPLGAVPVIGEKSSVLPPNSMSENRAQVDSNLPETVLGKHTVTIGLSLTRRSSAGHADTVTRQTAFDFNELQDRDYKYVSSTDSTGWRAGGGERGGRQGDMAFEGSEDDGQQQFGANYPSTPSGGKGGAPGTPSQQNYKVAAPDTTHIPIIHIDCDTPQEVDAIIAALARGEVFIPHMAIIPEALSVNGVSPPDLVVRFGTERNDDLDEWPNWCLEFMHNQLYEYFQGNGARWMKRPFSITLAKKVRWKTVKHMNRYFAHAERVIDAWREKGPQYLDPQLAYIEGGATPEEVSRPHGIYLLRNGIPTNYFAPNFDPPYTTKMTRSLLLNVLGKSWDKKRREWTSEPIPRLITPTMLVTAMCGCGDNSGGGFMANEVTLVSNVNSSNIPEGAIRSEPMTPVVRLQKPQQQQQQPLQHPPKPQQQQQQPPHQQQARPQQQQQQTPHAENEGADTDIISEPAYKNEQLNTPSQQSDIRQSFEERRPLDPVLSSENDENKRETTSPQSAFSGKHSHKDLDVDLDMMNLHLSSSTGTASKSTRSGFSARSPKYGRAPTPERQRLISPRSAHGEEENDMAEHMEHSASIRSSMDPAAADPAMELSSSSRPNSEYGQQPSLTGTTSTIMHMNLSAGKFMTREMDRRQGREEKKEEDVSRSIAEDVDERGPVPHLSSDEDWLDELGKPMSSPTSTSSPDAKTPKTSKNKAKDALEKERQRQIALIAMAQEQTSIAREQLASTLNDPAKLQLAEAVLASEKTKGNRSRHMRDANGVIQKNDSALSLEYSVDSASYMGEASGLMGQNYATDTSVTTTSTKGSSSIAAKSTFSNSRKQQTSAAQSAQSNKKFDEELSAFSIQESTSSMELVPTDEELFAVGWAKALDAKSGSYYYFTLDRTKIVWDNPLSLGTSADSMEEDFPMSAAAI
eukprot:CAMPEP_0117004742 /NCGR_PEP_ID=MMETSP0472-20121206/5600_1 /TAXON_ID=693140 ORGANISM="Tiarina fusus, Strain LIS" /NCGR_SAMPLE_ID=MMETSP0472 /ASSEMBLY_ACC=CAM_ASM_000603 /LENGTH=1102 /DNA_ID=CAMNT_0004705771 /DNA_START=220 /DNA_END=3528 /DNA_ORIENTATION=+